MNVNMNASSPQYLNSSIGITMLKKAIDLQAQNAMTLINAIPPQQSAAAMTSNLGNKIDTMA